MPLRRCLQVLVLSFVLAIPRGNALAAESDTLRLTVMATTDLHGWVLPWDYYEDKAEPRYGLAKVATLVDSVRSGTQHSLLLDAGDWLQGNALAEYYARVDSVSRYPLLAAVDEMGYDAMVLGNHEFNFGIDLLNRRLVQTETPILGANVYTHGSRTSAYLPYIIRGIDGVSVAVIGLTTPGSAVWDRPRVEGRLEFGDGLEAARRFVPEVRARGADIVVILAHTGYEGDTSFPADGLGPENFGRTVAEQVPDVDLVVLGHTHRVTREIVQGADGREVGVLQPGRWADHLGVAELWIVRDRSGPRVVQIDLRAHLVLHAPASPTIEALASDAHEAVRAHMAAPIAGTSSPWSTEKARLGPTAAVSLIHAAQFEATGADLSAAAAFSTNLTMGPESITLGQLTQLYPYENSLYVMEISGRDLRAYLEHGAQYYLTQESPGMAPRQNPGWPGYNFDMIEGVEYELDLTRPAGERIVRLEMHGRPFSDADTFTMAVNSYRAEGGGGFPGMTDANVIQRIERPVRDIIADYLRRRDSVDPNEIIRRNWTLTW
jgi:2',3'-cyclic-nucleotide 2'-phosphodiesterase (5'-nucleotidase family)